MPRLLTFSAVRKMLLGGLVASMIPAAAYGHRADSGPLMVCNASGARPVTGTFVYTNTAPASAGGSQTFNVAVGSCGPPIYYPLGTSVTVTEAAPPGYVVTGIKLTSTPGTGGPTTTVISANTPAARSATVTIGSGGSTLTFTTSAGAGGGGGGGGGGTSCKVPNVFGLTLTAAEAAVRKAHCTVGAVRKVYSNIYYPNIVYGQSPQHGAVLAPKAHVNLTVSLGHHP